jgi:hypothetical protein
LIDDGGPDQTQVNPNPVLLRGSDNQSYPQVAEVTSGCGKPCRRHVDNLEHDPEKWNPVFRKDHARTMASKKLPVDDESGALGDLVVERSRGEVGLVRLQVDA